MILLEKTQVFNFEGAIRGMRNPMNSWDKSDTPDDADVYIVGDSEIVIPIIGENDLALMRNLIKAGSDHRKFMRQIFVSVDITAPFYWWKEFDTYKVGTTANSCSTMHKIHAKEFTIDDFSYEHLIDEDDECCESYPVSIEFLKQLVDILNFYREKFNATKNKKYWWQMIQLLGMAYNQKRTVTLNYENLLNMYRARRSHKLDEWRTLCQWIEELPYAKELICDE